MSILTSLLLGYDGKYKIIGCDLTFKKSEPSKVEIFSDFFFANAANFLLNSKAFGILTFGYLHAFVHEMGHALALKILTGDSATINIDTRTCTGYTQGRKLNSIQRTLYSLGGPLANIAFSMGQIFTAVAARSYITNPVTTVVVIGAATWITGEFFLAAYSLIKDDAGDFAKISKNGILHLMTSTAAIVGVIGLGIFKTLKAL